MSRLPALLLFTLAACASGERNETASSSDTEPAGSASTARTAEADLADVTEYDLSMDKLDKYFQAQRNMAAKLKDMTPAEREAANAGNAANSSLEDMARNMERHPAIKDAIEDAGLSTREFATLTMAYIQAAMAASVLQMRPNDNQDSLVREMKASMDNIRFLRENEAEITRKQKALEAEMKQMGVPTE